MGGKIRGVRSLRPTHHALKMQKAAAGAGLFFRIPQAAPYPVALFIAASNGSEK